MSDDPRALLREARALVEARKNHTEHPHRTGVELAARGNFDAAAASFRRAIASNPDAPWSHVALGDALLELQRHDEALAAYREAVTRTPGSALALRESIGTGLGRSGDAGAAIDVLREVLAQAPDRSTTKVALARALLTKAAADQSEAASLLTNSDGGDVDDELVRAALAVAPHTAGLYRRLALSLAARGDHLGALTVAQIGLAHDPEDTGLVITLADVAIANVSGPAQAQLVGSTESIRRVFELVEAAFARQPDNVSLAERRALLADHLGDDSASAHAWGDLVELSTDDPMHLVEFGNRLAQAGRFEDAGAAFDRSIVLGYEKF